MELKWDLVMLTPENLKLMFCQNHNHGNSCTHTHTHQILRFKVMPKLFCVLLPRHFLLHCLMKIWHVILTNTILHFCECKERLKASVNLESPGDQLRRGGSFMIISFILGLFAQKI